MYNVLLILVTQIHGLEAFQLGKITSSSPVHFPSQLPHTLACYLFSLSPALACFPFPEMPGFFVNTMTRE